MEKDEFAKVATRNDSLVDFVTPIVRRCTKISFELHVNAPRACALSHMRRGPGDRVGKGPRPLPDMGIVELVRRYQVAYRPHGLQLFGKARIERDRRMQKQIAVFELHDRHARRERKRKRYSRGPQILERSIDDADIRREGLVLVEWLVDRECSDRHPSDPEAKSRHG